MTNEQIQALKAAAEKAGSDEWQTLIEDDEFKVIVKGSMKKHGGWSTHCPVAEDVANRAIAKFIAAANPAAILSLLASHEADKALIAELSAHLRNAHAFIENTEAFGGEAATGIIKCGGAEWNIDASKAALVNSPMEARTLTVKLPDYSEFAIVHFTGCSDDYAKGWVDGKNTVAKAYATACAAAGIKLQIKE